MLFQKLPSPDRTKTQLAYMAKYFPWSELTDGAKELIVWRKFLYMHKGILANSLNEDKTKIAPLDSRQEFQILWKYNNIPTQLEWEKKTDRFLIQVDLRIVNGIGRVALLSF